MDGDEGQDLSQVSGETLVDLWGLVVFPGRRGRAGGRGCWAEGNTVMELVSVFDVHP